jgi:hypothetical protein
VALGIVSDLELLARCYRVPKPRPSPAAVSAVKALAMIARQARALTNAIDGLTPALNRELDQARTLGDIGWGTPLALLGRLNDAARAVMRRAGVEFLVNTPSKKRRGRPREKERDMFMFRVGVILECRGVRVTKYDRGLFAETLRKLPPDLFPMPGNVAAIRPVIGPVVDVIRKLAPTELDDDYQSLVFFCRGTYVQ